MIPLMKYHACVACGKKHNFALPEGEWKSGCECSYLCPETGHKTALRIDVPTERAKYAPQGAVQLTPVACS